MLGGVGEHYSFLETSIMDPKVGQGDFEWFIWKLLRCYISGANLIVWDNVISRLDENQPGGVRNYLYLCMRHGFS